MAKKYYSTLTKIGLNAIARATTLNEKVKFSKFCIGDAEINPDENTTSLGHEVWQGTLSSITIDGNNPNWIVLTCIISATVGGFTIREVGIKDEDENLLAVASYPETYKPVLSEGAGKDLIVRVILEVSNTSAVELKIDPTVSLATREDVEALENKKADKEEVKKLEKKVEQNLTHLNVEEKQIGLDNSVEAKLPESNETLKVILSKFKKFLQGLHKVAFSGKYSDLTGAPTSFPPAEHNHDDRYLKKKETAEDSNNLGGISASEYVRTDISNEFIKPQSFRSDVGFFGAVQFKKPDGNYMWLHDLFQLSVDGKTTHINAINRLYGSDSGLTVNSPHTEIVDWWEKKVTKSGFQYYSEIIRNFNFLIPKPASLPKMQEKFTNVQSYGTFTSGAGGTISGGKILNGRTNYINILAAEQGRHTNFPQIEVKYKEASPRPLIFGSVFYGVMAELTTPGGINISAGNCIIIINVSKKEFTLSIGDSFNDSVKIKWYTADGFVSLPAPLKE